MKQTGYAPVDRGELYYVLEGDSAKPVVTFLHACICNHTMWDEQIAAFLPYFQVLRYDLRGFGASRTQDTQYVGHQDLSNVLDHVGVSKTALIGCSCGGQIALDFALTHPARVTALVSVCGGISGAGPKPDWFQSDEAKYFEQLDVLHDAQNFDELIERETHLWVNGRTQAPDRAPQLLRDRVRAMVRDSITRKDGKAERQPMNPPAAGQLENVRVPTLYVTGEHDVSGIQTAAELIITRVPNAQRIDIADTAHLPSMEHPAQFNQIVLAFLKKSI